ncbi:MAG TPA: alpha/beta hydrolase [Myxococcota bacterium]|nr:alpha/beta hydrolase [Myxococcota bacterium]
MTTVLLVHGAWHGAWCWEPAVRALEARGLRAVAPDLPMTSLRADVDCVSAAIRRHASGPLLVCGHSYGGVVITQASAEAAGAAQLVYLAAFVPDRGESLGSLIVQGPQTALASAVVFGSGETSTIDPAQATDVFYHDCSEALARDAIHRLRAYSAACFQTPVDRVGWREIPSSYIVCRDDRAIHPDAQRRMAERTGRVVEIPGSHSPFLAQPERLAEEIAELASGAGVEPIASRRRP